MQHKLYHKIQFSLILLFISSIALSQTIESYTLSLYDNVLDGGGKVFIHPLTNNGTEAASFGKDYADKIKLYMNSTGVGYVNGIKVYNPWLSTKIYQIVENVSEADYIISGDYKFETSESNTYEEKWIAETSETVDKKLPICYYNNIASSSASLNGKLIVKKGSTVVKNLPFKGTKSDSKTKSMGTASVSAPSTFISVLSKDAINTYSYSFSPRLNEIKYKFKNIKTKNKEFKGDLKSIEKQIKTLVKTGEINETGKKYLEIAGKEESPSVHYNIAVCYELIGNYTKAKVYYLKSADKEGIDRINRRIATGKKMESLGTKIVENEFL